MRTPFRSRPSTRRPAADGLMAYPFYFETCCLLYNKNYVDAAPVTIDDILAYADSYEGGDETADVENIFKWNVRTSFRTFSLSPIM